MLWRSASGFCSTCEVRGCGVARGVVSRAHCADDACDKQEGSLSHVPNARTLPDEIRHGSR
jgi:hypothetical protein